MSKPEKQSESPAGEREMIPLSAINQFLFCPRRAALIHVEGIFKDNHHTLRGDIIHEHADLAGYEVVKGAKLLRALPVFSERLGMNGKCDIVEQRPDGSLFPVEFKLGKRRQWENDDAQLCAQALCLEEMFGVPVPRGAIFHAESKRRREVEFTPELRGRTEQAIRELRALFRGSQISDFKSQIAPLPCAVPRAVPRPACKECSLFDICLPRATGIGSQSERLAGQLFEI